MGSPAAAQTHRAEVLERHTAAEILPRQLVRAGPSPHVSAQECLVFQRGRVLVWSHLAIYQALMTGRWEGEGLTESAIYAAARRLTVGPHRGAGQVRDDWEALSF